MAGANLVSGLLTAASKSRNFELAAVLLMALPANTGNLTKREASRETLLPFPRHAVMLQDACKQSMLSELTLLEPDKKIVCIE